MKRVISLFACGSALAFGGQAVAQDSGAQADEIAAEEADSEATGSDEVASDETGPDGMDVNLDAIDALLGNSEVTAGGTSDDISADSEDDSETPDDNDAAEEEETENDPSEGPGPSDLDRAYAAYAICASTAGEAIEARGFSMDIIGEEALLRCAGERAAYVNAFYFSLLPRYSAEGEEETAIRARAERLVAATDRFLITKVGEEAAALRTAREAEAAAALAAEAAAEAAEEAEAAAEAAAAEQSEDAAEPASEDENE